MVFVVAELLAAIAAEPRRPVLVHVAPEAAMGSKTAAADAAVVGPFSAAHLAPSPARRCRADYATGRQGR